MEQQKVNSYAPSPIDSAYSQVLPSDIKIKSPDSDSIIHRVPNPMSHCNDLTQSTFYPGVNRKAIIQGNEETKLQEKYQAIQELFEKTCNEPDEFNSDEVLKLLKALADGQPQETSILNKARKLAGFVAELNGKLETGIKTAGALVTDSKTIGEKFIQQLTHYNDLCGQARKKEEEVKQEVARLTKETTPEGNSARSLSHKALERVQTIGWDVQEVIKDQADHVQAQITMTQTLNNLEAEWIQVVDGLETAYKQLQWFEVLKTKPANISTSNYYKEYLGGERRVGLSAIFSPNIASLKNKAPLTEELRLLKSQIKEMSSETDTLIQSTRHNLKNNIKDYARDCTKIIADFKALAQHIQKVEEEVHDRLVEIDILLKESSCKELQAPALKSLEIYSHYHANIMKAPRAQEALRQKVNVWQTERATIDTTWNNLLNTIETSRGQLNRVITLICNNQQPAVNPEPLLLKPVLAPVKKEPVISLADEVEKAIASFKKLEDAVSHAIKDIHNTASSVWNPLASFSGSMPKALPQIQEQYNALYDKYTILAEKNEALVDDLEETIVITKRAIKENTLQTEPVGLQAYLLALGKAQGNEEAYAKKAAKYHQEFHEIKAMHQSAQSRLETAEMLLETLNRAAKEVNDRLSRLSQAYLTGSLPNKTLNPPLETAPNPKELNAQKKVS